jgi:hypothetical protein
MIWCQCSNFHRVQYREKFSLANKWLVSLPSKFGLQLTAFHQRFRELCHQIWLSPKLFPIKLALFTNMVKMQYFHQSRNWFRSKPSTKDPIWFSLKTVVSICHSHSPNSAQVLAYLSTSSSNNFRQVNATFRDIASQTNHWKVLRKHRTTIIRKGIPPALNFLRGRLTISVGLVYSLITTRLLALD